MNGRRVVVTGMAGITALGNDWPTIRAACLAGRSGIRRMAEWDRYAEMNTRLGGPIEDFAPPCHWTRKQLHSMGRVSQLAVAAAERALDAPSLTPAQAALALLERLRADSENSLALPPADAAPAAILQHAEVHGLTAIEVSPAAQPR